MHRLRSTIGRDGCIREGLLMDAAQIDYASRIKEFCRFMLLGCRSRPFRIPAQAPEAFFRGLFLFFILQRPSRKCPRGQLGKGLTTVGLCHTFGGVTYYNP